MFKKIAVSISIVVTIMVAIIFPFFAVAIAKKIINHLNNPHHSAE